MLSVGGDELLWSSSAVLALTASVLLPVAIAGAVCREQKKWKEQEGGPDGAWVCLPGARKPSPGRVADCAPADAPADDPRRPELEVRDWQQAGQLPGCPWSFDGCEDVQDALERIWRRPLARDLRPAFEALRASVRGIQVARAAPAAGGARFAAVYALRGGATLFGGAPLEHAVGVELGDCPPGRGASPLGSRSPRGGSRSPRRGGLRRRRGDSPPGPASEAPELPLPCLAPFYRVHDGFGVLLAAAHLPGLLREPTEALGGSCFYVYPVRGLEEAVPASGLVAFARVDRRCVACADGGAEWPGVVYMESGERVEDEGEEEGPLAFVAETVCNVVGRDRALPGGAGRADAPSPFAG